MLRSSPCEENPRVLCDSGALRERRERRVERQRRAGERPNGTKGAVCGRCVCAEDTCERRARADDTSGQQLQRNQGKSRLPYLSFSLFVGELCVSGVEASSIRIESCKFPDCRVKRL